MNIVKSIKPVLFALITVLFLKMFIFDFIVGKGNSMEPTIKDGTFLVISRIRYGLRFPWQKKYLIRWDKPSPGEVVVFRSPFEDGELLIKRCMGLYDNNNFYALGDNINISYDSRSYGKVPLDNIIGKVLGY